MKFSDLPFDAQHSFAQFFSAAGRQNELEEFFSKFDLPQENFLLLLKVFEDLDPGQLKVLFAALLGKTVFADIASGGGATEIIARVAASAMLLGFEPSKILVLVSFENQADIMRERITLKFPELKALVEKAVFFTASVFLEKVLLDKIDGESPLVRLGMTDDFRYSSRWLDILAETRNGIDRSLPLWVILSRKITGKTPAGFSHLEHEVEEIFRTYEVALENQKIFDRIGVCKLIRRFALENSPMFEKHFAKYKFVFVDDAQRFVKEEWEVIRLFSVRRTLAAAGDFGATFYKPSDIKFDSRAERFVFNKTFRHTPEVTECLNKISSRQIITDIPSDKPGFVYYEAGDEEDELEFIAFQAKNLIGEGIPASSIGVVYRGEKFPKDFRPVAIKFGLNCMEYPGAGMVLPFAQKIADILDGSPFTPTMELLKKTLPAEEFGRVKNWFEKRLRYFGPYDAISDRNKIVAQDLRKMRERKDISLKLVAGYFAKAYQFDVLFVPQFEVAEYPAVLKGLFYTLVSRARRGVFLTRPIAREPRFYWQKKLETLPSPLLEFLPKNAEKSLAGGGLSRILRKIF
ncbi:MAG: hypothetical protein J7L54_07580 [Elusimicrobia bacterium]|nr:hypothetical protein [Elusimicrobiota bacterium]